MEKVKKQCSSPLNFKKKIIRMFIILFQNMNSASFIGVQSHFMTKVSDLQKLVEIRVAVKDDHECLEHLEVSTK